MDTRPTAVVVNFGRFITEAQKLEIGMKSGAKDVVIVGVAHRFNLSEALAPQIKAIMEDVARDVRSRENIEVVINPPAFAPAAAIIGRMYHSRRFVWFGKSVIVE